MSTFKPMIGSEKDRRGAPEINQAWSRTTMRTAMPRRPSSWARFVFVAELTWNGLTSLSWLCQSLLGRERHDRQTSAALTMALPPAYATRVAQTLQVSRSERNPDRPSQRAAPRRTRLQQQRQGSRSTSEARRELDQGWVAQRFLRGRGVFPPTCLSFLSRAGLPAGRQAQIAREPPAAHRRKNQDSSANDRIRAARHSGARVPARSSA